MNIRNDVSLKDYSTMRLGGRSKFLIEVNSDSELTEAVAWAKTNNLPYLMIGEGSNLFWRDEGFSGVVLVNKILGVKTEQISEHEYLVTANAGENWDKLVGHCTNQGMSGIEYLSLIPGSCGAAPIQNIGAYGSDLSKVLVSLSAYDTSTNKFINLSSEECILGYRDSVFKHQSDRNHYLITSITIKLGNKNPELPYYPAIEEYFKVHKIKQITSMVIRDAVINIRSLKLPDPKLVPNNGSFFANPIIDEIKFQELFAKFPKIVYWKMEDSKVKLSAGRLIEIAGFKDKFDPETGMATWHYHTLTLVNKSAKSTKDLLVFRDKIVDRVRQEFDINLEQEPELLP
jgi:UDP-N-acetylmuramate dehydrogenase